MNFVLCYDAHGKKVQVEKVRIVTETATVPPHVRRLAQVLRQLTPEEMSQLVQLVPEVKRARASEVLEEEREAAEYFRKAAMELTEGKLPSRQDEFIEGLTYEEYFALSEAEQEALWKQIFAEEERGPYGLEEHDAEPDARVATG